MEFDVERCDRLVYNTGELRLQTGYRSKNVYVFTDNLSQFFTDISYLA